MAKVTRELLRLPTGSQTTGAGSRVGFPAKKFPKERIFCVFRVNRILFILLSGITGMIPPYISSIYQEPNKNMGVK